MSRTVRSEVDFLFYNFFFVLFFSLTAGVIRKTHAYRTQLAEPDPTQVSDLKISHGKWVKKKHAAVGVYARSCPYYSGFNRHVNRDS